MKHTKDKIIGIILLIQVAILPIIVRLYARPMPKELVDMLGRGEVYANFYSYWRSVIIIISAITIAFYLISDYLTTTDKKPDIKELLLRPPVTAFVILLFFSLISTFASSYPRTSWLGTFDRAEGMVVWFAYFTIFLTAMSFTKSIDYTKIIIFGLAFSSIIMGTIAFFQLIGRDLFATEFILPFIAGREIAAEIGKIEPLFDIAYATLFNPNTLGMYGAMTAPILLFAGAFYSCKWYARIPIILGGILMIIAVFASRSFAGFVGFGAGSIVGVFTLAFVFIKRKEQKIAWKKVGAFTFAFLLIIGLSFGFITPLRERLNHQIARLANEMEFERSINIDYTFDFDKITLSRNSQDLYTIQFSLTGDFIRVWDAMGEEIAVNMSNNIYSFDIPGLGVQTIINHGEYFTFRGINYALVSSGQIAGVGFGGILIDMEEPILSFGFKNLEHWGSGRGFIWSRTFPLMPSKTIIGSGPDTFPSIFPNHDLIGGMRVYNTPTFIDKAHNIFLHIWISNGGIAAISLMFIIGFYLFTTFKSLIKHKESWESTGLKIGLITGVFSFLIASMSTDSTIPTTTVFLILLGMGYGLNYIRKQKI